VPVRPGQVWNEADNRSGSIAAAGRFLVHALADARGVLTKLLPVLWHYWMETQFQRWASSPSSPGMARTVFGPYHRAVRVSGRLSTWRSIPMSTEQFTAQLAVCHLHATFLTILPRIITHGQAYFRFLQCPIAREDAIAEMVAVAWKWHLRIAQRGKDVSEFVSTVATFAARAVNCGRRLTGMEKPKDVLSHRAQREHGFKVESLPAFSPGSSSPFLEALRGNTETPVVDQVIFRQDFPDWRRTRTDRDRRIIDQLMVGERTSAVAARFGLSPSRISKLRHELHRDWRQFCGDYEEAKMDEGVLDRFGQTAS
jgi:hypothetical protein